MPDLNGTFLPIFAANRICVAEGPEDIADPFISSSNGFLICLATLKGLFSILAPSFLIGGYQTAQKILESVHWVWMVFPVTEHCSSLGNSRPGGLWGLTLPTVVSRWQLTQILNIFHCFIVFNSEISVLNLGK